MNLYEIVGNPDSELAGDVFGHFTTKELAEKALETMDEAFKEECTIRKSNLEINTIVVDDETIRFTEQKDPEEIKNQAREDGFVEGYVTLDLSQIIEFNFEVFLDLLSEELVGHQSLMEINYNMVECDKETNTVTFHVTGYLSE